MTSHQTALDDDDDDDKRASFRTPLARGASLRDLEEAGQATIPVHHETHANAADLIGCGRALAFRMAADGQLPTIRLGRRVVVPVARLRAMLDRPPSESSCAIRLRKRLTCSDVYASHGATLRALTATDRQRWHHSPTAGDDTVTDRMAWRRAVERSRLPSCVKLTLLVHAERGASHWHDDDLNEHAFPRADLADRRGTDESTVRRHYRRAEAAGYLVQHERAFPGNQAVFHYVTPTEPWPCEACGMGGESGGRKEATRTSQWEATTTPIPPPRMPPLVEAPRPPQPEAWTRSCT